MRPRDDDADRALAADSIRCLAPLVKNSHQLTVLLQADDGPGERPVLPTPAVQLLKGNLAPARSNYPVECRSGKIERVRSRHRVMDIAGRFGKARDWGVPTQ